MFLHVFPWGFEVWNDLTDMNSHYYLKKKLPLCLIHKDVYRIISEILYQYYKDMHKKLIQHPYIKKNDLLKDKTAISDLILSVQWELEQQLNFRWYLSYIKRFITISSRYSISYSNILLWPLMFLFCPKKSRLKEINSLHCTILRLNCI